MTSPKWKVLTLQQKVDVIKLLDSGKAACKIAAELGVGKTQIQNLRKRKFDILSDYENNVPTTSKRRRYTTGNEEIELTYEWFKSAIARQTNVTGGLLKEKALKFA
jgi:kinesin family protein 6/9